MIAPVRLRLSRREGFDLAEHSRAANGLDVVVVARPGPLGNPFVTGTDGTAAECVELHRTLLAGYLAGTYSPSIAALEAHRDAVRAGAAAGTWRNRNVACWCALGKPCHGDTLLEIFNRAGRA